MLIITYYSVLFILTFIVGVFFKSDLILYCSKASILIVILTYVFNVSYDKYSSYQEELITNQKLIEEGKKFEALETEFLKLKTKKELERFLYEYHHQKEIGAQLYDNNKEI